jgi:uncharacterized protein YicC (UPF0701 family)
MNDKELLQKIKNVRTAVKEIYGNVNTITYPIYMVDWLIEQAEKVEKLQQENERLNTLLDQSRAGKLTVSRRLEFAEEEIDRLKADIEEALELLKRGGPGTRSQVQRLLEQALEG